MRAAALSDFLMACRTGSIDWEPRPAAAAGDIAKLSALLPGAPETYLEFLAEMDGGDGALLTDAPITYLRLWSASWSIEANDSYEIQRWMSGYWGIGDNGGSELLAFDRAVSGWPLYAVPFVPMDTKDRIPVAASFSDMLRCLGRANSDSRSGP